MKRFVILLVSLLAVPALASAAPITAPGPALAQACAACHGPGGRSQGAIPVA